ALPPELRHRAGPQGSPRNRGEASDLVGSSLTSGLRARLQLALLLPVLGDRYPLSLVHFLATHTSGQMAWDQVGCGGRIRTDDLRVMSPTSCRCSTPRLPVYPPPSGGPPATAAVRMTILRTPKGLVRTLPATVKALVCLMLRRSCEGWRRRRL